MRARLTILLWWLCLAAGVQAHPILQNPVWIDPAPEKLTLYLHVTVRELIVVQGLTVDTDGIAEPAAAADMADRHKGYVLDHFHIKADSVPLEGKVVKITPPDEHQTGVEGPDNTRFVFLIEYPLRGLPRAFTFRHNMCREYPTAPGVPWDFSYAARYGAPPLGTAQLFFPMLADKDYEIDTGRAELAGGTATSTGGTAPRLVQPPRQNHWLALWLVFSVLAVCSLQPLPQMWLRGALAAWMTGFIAASLTGMEVPAPLTGALCCVATLLLGIDNIHNAAARAGLRRGLILTAGGFCFGWALFAQRPEWITSPRQWPLIAFGAAVAAAALCGIAASRARRAGSTGSRAALQIASLGGCGVTVWLLLTILDIRLF